jgi:hypothetical protein
MESESGAGECRETADVTYQERAASPRLGVSRTGHLKITELQMQRLQNGGKRVSIHWGSERAGAPAEGVHTRRVGLRQSCRQPKLWLRPTVSRFAGP